MRIDRIILKNFRNFKETEIGPFAEGLNLFFGPNGSGKSNILEGIGLSSLGKSCRNALDQDMVNFGTRSATVEIFGEIEKKKPPLVIP